MTVKEMIEVVSGIDIKRNVNIYVSYDTEIGWKFEMYTVGKGLGAKLTRVIPPNQIALWDLDILKRFLERMADDIEIGVTN